MEKRFILILGGARSGKSAFACRLASQWKTVLFVATATPDDAEMAQRIEDHRRSRPAHWRTVEEPMNPVRAIAESGEKAGVVVVDCLTLWLSNLAGAEADWHRVEAETQAQIQELGRLYRSGSASLIVVSNEVGWGLVPPYPMGRAYRDLLGKVNQSLASLADQVYLMVASLPVEIKRLASP